MGQLIVVVSQRSCIGSHKWAEAVYACEPGATNISGMSHRIVTQMAPLTPDITHTV